MERLTHHAQLEDERKRIVRTLDKCATWLCRISARRGAKASSHSIKNGCAETHLRLARLTKADWELCVAHNRLLLFLSIGDAAQWWRVESWSEKGVRVRFQLSRRAGGERTLIELIPMTALAAAHAEIEAARTRRCIELARFAQSKFEEENGRKVEIYRARLSAGRTHAEPGRYARILLSDRGKLIAATGAVVEIKKGSVERFIASALLWFVKAREKFSQRRNPPREIKNLWLLAPPDLTEEFAARLALLREDLRRAIRLFAIDDAERKLTNCAAPDLRELFAMARGARGVRIAPKNFSRTSLVLQSLAPEAIDIVRARGGETLRFQGLSFARVRRVGGVERVWFGVSSKRRILDDANRAELIKLIDDLNERRRAPPHESANQITENQISHDPRDKSDAQGELFDNEAAQFDSRKQSIASHESNAHESNAHSDSLNASLDEMSSKTPSAKKHALYAAAAEAWLEAILRRDITRLDPGLRLAPLHAQFRASSETRAVDLLAIRRDGRLVVIELKTSEDALFPLQAADYWRRVELERLCGHIAKAKLFGDAEIANAAPLVYLVAPMLRFHRAFETVAQFIAPEIELYRFDINEDWRAGVRTLRRERINAERCL